MSHAGSDIARQVDRLTSMFAADARLFGEQYDLDPEYLLRVYAGVTEHCDISMERLARALSPKDPTP